MKLTNFKKFNLLYLLLIVSFLNKTIFTIIVPIWHTPDEQAHFAQTAYFGEFNKMPKTPPDLNAEILESERLLGTERDNQGNNKFTFHPEYKIEYTQSTMGKHEEEIKNIPYGDRKILVKQESANYPPLYYWITGLAYKLFYDSDLVTRVYVARFISILLGVAMTYLSFLIARELFPKNKILQITLPTLVTFHPMLAYVFSGVTSDNLMNFLYTLFLYYSILIIRDINLRKNLILSLFTIIALFFTKPQFILAFPTLLLAIIFFLLLSKKISQNKKVSLLMLGFTITLLPSLFFTNEQLFSSTLGILYSQNYFPVNPASYTQLSFIQHLKNTLSHTVREVIPWYWGVFNWLGVVFPIEIIRTINRILIIAGIGLIFKLIALRKKRLIEDYIFLYLIFASLIYFAGITVYNYFASITIGFPFGIQGRYYFPTIVAHMAILLVGLITLIPQRFKDLGAKIIACLIVGLNFYTLYLLAKTYYEITSFKIFIQQVSQYKVEIFKGDLVAVWLLIYFLLFALFIYNFLKAKNSFIRNS